MIIKKTIIGLASCVLSVSTFSQDSLSQTVTSTTTAVSQDSIEIVTAEDIAKFELISRSSRCLCQPIALSAELIVQMSTEPIIMRSETSVLPDIALANVYPNPAISQTTLKIEVNSELLYEVRMLDLAGREIQHIHSGLLKKGFHEFNIDLSNNESGTYTVLIKTENSFKSVKLQKLN